MENGTIALGRQVIIYGLGDALYKTVAFFLLPVYLKYLSPTEYGTIEALSATRALFVTLVAMGLPNSIFRFYYRARDENERKRIISTIFFLCFIIQIVVTFLFWWKSRLISTLLLKKPDCELLVAILALNIFLVSFRAVPLSLLRAKNKAIAYTIVNLIVSVTTLLSNIVFVSYLQKGVLGVLLGNLCGGVMGICILLPYLLKELKISIDVSCIGRILSFSVPLGLAVIPLTIIFMADRYYIAQFVGLKDLGIYALGYKLSSVIKLFLVMPFILAWGPFVFSIENKENAKAIYSRITTYYVMVGLFIVVLICVFQHDIVKIFTKNESYHAATKIIPILCYAFFFYGLANVIRGVAVRISGKTYYTTIILVIGMLVNLSMNSLLINRFGYAGAAHSLLVTFLVASVLSYYFSTKLYDIDYDIFKIFRIILVSISIIAINNTILTIKMVADYTSIVLIFKFINVMFFIIYILLVEIHDNERRRIRLLFSSIQ